MILQYNRGELTQTVCLQFDLVPCVTYHYGEKLHFDQNEKLVMFGVTHVLAMDGHSRMIIGFVTIPMKNSVALHASLFRPIILKCGMFDQVRTDHGRQCDLVLAVQESLSALRVHTSRRSCVRIQSKNNLRAERFWVEINHRVNYPLKACLRALEEEEKFDGDRFCVSWAARQVAFAAIMIFIKTWNSHRIPGYTGLAANILFLQSRSN